MREREKFEIGEAKERIFRRDWFLCKACGKYIFDGYPQLAHGISQSKANIKKYGADIVHSDWNIHSVCSLKCNSKMAVGKTREPLEAERIRLLIDQEKDE